MMNSKFKKVILDAHNALKIGNISLSLLGINFKDAEFKIDTGCGYSTIPIQRLNVSERQAQAYKRNDANSLVLKLGQYINNGYTLKQAVKIEHGNSFKLSYGIESGGKNNKQPDFLSIQDLMNTEAISFKHKIMNIDLDGMKLDDTDIYINYDRKGNILLGMDVFKNWDIHTGKDKNGDYIFLGCPYDQINEEYLLELENTFHLGSDINAAIAKENI